MPNLTGGKWGASTLGTPGGVVTWSIAGPGLSLNAFGSVVVSSSFAMPQGLGFDLLTPIRDAFEIWSDAGNIEFIQVEDGGGAAGVGDVADIRIFFGSFSGGFEGFAFFPPPLNGIAAGDIALNAFTVGQSELFARTLTVHEIGHSLGLDHVGIFAAMNPQLVTDILQPDDITGIHQIYGAQDFGPTAYTLPGSQQNLNILFSPQPLTVHGNALGNEISGTDNIDTINGEGGSDSLFGGLSNDVLDGGANDDTLNGGAGDDTIIGGAGADSIDGGTGSNDTADYSNSAATVTVRLDGTVGVGGDAAGDTLTNVENLIGSANRDFLIGDANVNTLMGGDSADNLQGGPGADVLDGGDGFDFADYQEVTTTLTFDFVTFSNSSLVIREDTLIDIEAYAGALNATNIYNGKTGPGTTGNEYFIAGNLGDEINGNNGNDTLRSERGNDTVDGGAGSDLIVGGLDDDLLSGGGVDGAVDGFLFFDNDGTDVVTDFELGQDKLAWVSNTFNALTDLTLSTSVNGFALVTYGTSTVEVLNVTQAQLNDMDNFFFF